MDEKFTNEKSSTASLRSEHCNLFKGHRLANNLTRGAPRGISGFHLMDKNSANVVSWRGRVLDGSV